MFGFVFFCSFFCCVLLVIGVMFFCLVFFAVCFLMVIFFLVLFVWLCGVPFCGVIFLYEINFCLSMYCLIFLFIVVWVWPPLPSPFPPCGPSLAKLLLMVFWNKKWEIKYQLFGFFCGCCCCFLLLGFLFELSLSCIRCFYVYLSWIVSFDFLEPLLPLFIWFAVYVYGINILRL